MSRRLPCSPLWHLILASFLLLSVVACNDGSLGLREPPTPTAPAAAATPTAARAAEVSTTAAVSAAPTLVLPVGPYAVIDVVKRVKPAVVNIASERVSYESYLWPEPQMAGLGSGVIFDPRGYVLTNNHVVEDADVLKVSLPDGRTFDGKLVGADPRSDLAVVKIDGDDLPIAELGDSDGLQVGQWVVAIGNALALSGGPTVTAGVVGALGRSIETRDGGVLYDLVQTDAAINPGNSGGPLLDLSGRVVGINTAIAQAPGAGIGFAISINRAKPIAQALVDHGRVSRPWLGVGLASVTPALAARYDLPLKRGVIITRIVRNSPAATAGLEPGDIIFALDNSAVDDVVALFKAMDRHKVGDKVKLSIARPTGQIEIEVTLEEMPTP